MSKRKRISEILLYSASPLAIIVTAPILARGLGPEGRGELGVLQAVASLALSAGALGQSEVLLAERKYVANAFGSTSTVALAGGLIATALTIPALLAMGYAPLAVFATMLLVPLLVQIQVWRSLAIAEGRLRLPALQNALASLGRILSLGALLALGLLSTASSIFVIQAVLAISALMCFIPLVRREINSSRAPVRVHDLLAFGRTGAPLIVFTLLTSVTLRADLIVLQFFVEPSEVGVYAAATSLTMAILSISPAFKARVQVAALGFNRFKNVKGELRIALFFAVAGSIGLFALAPVIVDLLLGPDYQSAITLLRYLSLSCGALPMLDVIQGLLAAVGSRRHLVYVGAIGSTTTALLLAGLVPTYGLYGAASAATVGYSATAFAGWRFACIKMAKDTN